MISSLRGKLITAGPDDLELALDVQGVGYQIFVSKNTYAKLPVVGESLFLFIYTAVREDAIQLYGFAEEREKKLFQKLILVNGIGPKLAMTILSGISPSELVQAILQENLVRLTAISGVGKKTAERIILDLKDRMIAFTQDTTSVAEPTPRKQKIFEEAISALVNLGYTRVVAEKMLNEISLEESPSLESIIRKALKNASEARRA